VFRIALALGLKLLPAAFCALLFGIHPMRVESVAWITERKDVLYGTFYLLALYYYIKSVKLSFQKRYVFIILLSFTLALLSKIQAVVLPLSMLLVDYYFYRKLSMKLIYEKWLYFLLSLVTGIAGIYLLRAHGSLENAEHLSFFGKILVGSYAYVVYFLKSVVPYNMVPFYTYPDKIGWIFYGSMAFALSILSSIFYFFKIKKRAWVFGLLFFTFNIMFLLQILSAGQAFIADRFTYIAYLGLFFIYACGFQWVLGKYAKLDKLICVTALFILGLFGYMNFKQNKIWENSDILWSHVLNYYPKNAYALTNRARYYYDTGLFEKAIHDYNKIIDQDRYNSEIYYGRGISYAQLNMFGNALQDLDAVERLDSANRNIYSSRYNIYTTLGLYDEAQTELEKYLNLNPNNPDMWLKLGTVSRLNKQYKNSLNAFNTAIQINPNNTAYYYERLITYYEMGDIERARNDLNFLKSKGFKDISPEYEMINQEK
jgi:tetratricopeptide (TPR) repeat protein